MSQIEKAFPRKFQNQKKEYEELMSENRGSTKGGAAKAGADAFGRLLKSGENADILALLLK